MNKLITFLLIAISTQAVAMDTCIGGVFEFLDRERTGITINFQADMVAYGYWWGLVPVEDSPRNGLPTWFQLYGRHIHSKQDSYTPVAEFSIGMAFLKSEMWEDWDAEIDESAGTAWLYESDDNLFVFVWSLLRGADGLACEGICDGEFIARRVTQPQRCEQ